jgi:regulator of protease activity HflC (stomatin/prohibitin superfamily)
MITLIISVLSIIVAIFIALMTKSNFTTQTHYGPNTNIGRWLTKPIVIIVVGLIIGLVQPYKLDRVDAGNVGVKVKLSGDKRGVSKYEYKTGWVVFNTWAEQLYEFPVFQQTINYEKQDVITKGGFPATIHPSFNYSLKAGSVGDMFQNLRLDIKTIEQGWLQNAIVGAINDVANRWEVDKIFNEREHFEAAIKTECNKRLSKWFIVSQLRTNIIPPGPLQETIIAKTKAIQQAQAEDQKALTAEAEARKKVAIANGNAQQTIIEAKAQAEAMKIRKQEITPLYVEYLKWIDIDPTTPRVPQVVGSTAVLNQLK